MGDYDWIGPAVGAGAQVFGTALGGAAQDAERAKQLELLKSLLAKYQGIPDPKFNDVAPDTYGPSALGGIQSDPRLLQQEGEVDAGLKNVVNSGGLTLEDRAAQAGLYDKLSRQTSGQNASIRNNASARGALNSGSALALQLAGGQGATQQASDSARDISANAQLNGLKAMQQRYANASGMDNQQYQRKAAAAQATDAINAHNASAARNAGLYANDQRQRAFDNSVTKVAGQRGPTNDLGSHYAQSGDIAARRGAAYGKAIKGGINDYMQDQDSLSADERDQRRRAADSAWESG